ncbi:hypothetical protein BSN85_35835 [Bradyrhizobium brasilense]|nr:hypothetical protein BSN85_35835 [Bradyrhizobium brasilense]
MSVTAVGKDTGSKLPCAVQVEKRVCSRSLPSSLRTAPAGAPSPCRSTHGAGRPRWTAWSAPSNFPRALSAISETYGDWIVKCQLDGGAKLCTLGQTQFAKETNQQIFAIELIPRDGKAEGNILMPFGLKFDCIHSASLRPETDLPLRRRIRGHNSHVDEIGLRGEPLICKS